MPPKPASLLDRLLSWRVVNPETGCWLPRRCRSYNDYCRIGYKGEKRLIHRLSAVAYLGLELTSKLQVNHKPICPYKACFNPEHLYIGTAKDNSMDYSNSKTHCKNGHEMTDANTYIFRLRYGARKGSIIKNCRMCGMLNARRYRA